MNDIGTTQIEPTRSSTLNGRMWYWRICTLLVLLIIEPSVAAFADGPRDRVVIHLLDPRGAIAGEQTMPIQWNGGKADLIATRRLNAAEDKKLRTFLHKELADDNNIPFCGHSPAYAVAIIPTGKQATTVTLCGMCGTLAKRGAVKALHGNESLKFLDTLLPLPDVFRAIGGKPPQLMDPFYDGNKSPFHLLDVTIDG